MKNKFEAMTKQQRIDVLCNGGFGRPFAARWAAQQFETLPEEVRALFGADSDEAIRKQLVDSDFLKGEELKTNDAQDVVNELAKDNVHVTVGQVKRVWKEAGNGVRLMARALFDAKFSSGPDHRIVKLSNGYWVQDGATPAVTERDVADPGQSKADGPFATKQEAINHVEMSFPGESYALGFSAKFSAVEDRDALRWWDDHATAEERRNAGKDFLKKKYNELDEKQKQAVKEYMQRTGSFGAKFATQAQVGDVIEHPSGKLKVLAIRSNGTLWVTDNLEETNPEAPGWTLRGYSARGRKVAKFSAAAHWNEMTLDQKQGDAEALGWDESQAEQTWEQLTPEQQAAYENHYTHEQGKMAARFAREILRQNDPPVHGSYSACMVVYVRTKRAALAAGQNATSAQTAARSAVRAVFGVVGRTGAAKFDGKTDAVKKAYHDIQDSRAVPIEDLAEMAGMIAARLGSPWTAETVAQQLQQLRFYLGHTGAAKFAGENVAEQYIRANIDSSEDPNQQAAESLSGQIEAYDGKYVPADVILRVWESMKRRGVKWHASSGNSFGTAHAKLKPGGSARAKFAKFGAWFTLSDLRSRLESNGATAADISKVEKVLKRELPKAEYVDNKDVNDPAAEYPDWLVDKALNEAGVSATYSAAKLLSRKFATGSGSKEIEQVWDSADAATRTELMGDHAAWKPEYANMRWADIRDQQFRLGFADLYNDVFGDFSAGSTPRAGSTFRATVVLKDGTQQSKTFSSAAEAVQFVVEHGQCGSAGKALRRIASTGKWSALGGVGVQRMK